MRGLPWDAIDMDFMNLNQSAHGDRECGLPGDTRMRARAQGRGRPLVRTRRSQDAPRRLDRGRRRAWHDCAGRPKILPASATTCADVAVTEGDKVAAEARSWAIRDQRLSASATLRAPR